MPRDCLLPKRMLCSIVLTVSFFIAANAIAAPAAPDQSAARKKLALQQAMKIQVPFVANEGQINDPGVKYYARTFGGNFYVRDNGEMVYLVASRPDKKDGRDFGKPETPDKLKSALIRETLVGAKKTVPRALDKAATEINSFIGSDPAKWRTHVPTYGSVSLGEVYDGITLSLRSYGKTVEKVFTVSPGADPESIRLSVSGAGEMKVNGKGDLVVSTGIGSLGFSKPVAYQEIGNRRVDVAVAYRAEKDSYSFILGEYDKRHPVVIDPYLEVSTYIGGYGTDDATSVAFDGTGCIYVAGRTNSSVIPDPGHASHTLKNNYDVFVSKLSADGKSLIYSTFLGGHPIFPPIYGAPDNDGEQGYIAVDPSGIVYVTGWTQSSQFPTTPGALQTTHGGGGKDAFFSIISQNGGSLLYSTYYGGFQSDVAVGIALDATGAYIAGATNTTAWVTKFSLSGFPIYTKDLGNGFPEGIAVDGAGNAHVVGYILGAGGDKDAFVTKLYYDGATIQILYSTILAGSGNDTAKSVALDSVGNAYVAGVTNSPNFPTKPGAFQSIRGSGTDTGFITKLDVTTGAIVASTYLGGTVRDSVNGIAIAPPDLSGKVYAYVTGDTDSQDFPTTPDAQNRDCANPCWDMFISKLSADLSQLDYSTCYTAGGCDAGRGIAVGAVGGLNNVYVAGTNNDGYFFSRLDAYQVNSADNDPKEDIQDAFVVKYTSAAPDFAGPEFAIITPEYTETTTHPVPYPVSFEVRITDPSGVYYQPSDPQWSIIMRKRNSLIPQGDFSYNATTGILTYTASAGWFSAGECTSVTIEARDMLRNPNSITLYFSVADPANPDPDTGWYPCPNPSIASPAVCLKDSDYDGIPDDGKTLSDDTQAQDTALWRDYGSEIIKGTNMSKKTLYIKALQKDSNGVGPWIDFDRHLQVLNASQGPFDKLNIELVQVPVNYNPYTDPDAQNLTYRPPISIVEITNDLTDEAEDTAPTYFSSTSKTWNWGNLGVTPYKTGACDNKTKYGYFQATIYGNAIKRYVYDRQYAANLNVGASPLSTPVYSTDPNDTNKSPMNFGNDGTVEINAFEFSNTGKITVKPSSAATPYWEDNVIQRVIAHEIGHTLLNASEGDHCDNPNCIMYGAISSVAGWGIAGTGIGFGPGAGKFACTHTESKTYDLRSRVWNALYPLYLPPNSYTCPQ